MGQPLILKNPHLRSIVRKCGFLTGERRSPRGQLTARCEFFSEAGEQKTPARNAGVSGIPPALGSVRESLIVQARNMRPGNCRRKQPSL